MNKPFSYKSASEFTGLSERTLRRMSERGELRIVKVGRRVLIPYEEIERIVTGGKSTMNDK